MDKQVPLTRDLTFGNKIPTFAVYTNIVGRKVEIIQGGKNPQAIRLSDEEMEVLIDSYKRFKSDYNDEKK